MKRISSSWTFYYKRIFPATWFGFLLLFVIVPLVTHSTRSPPVPFLIFPVVMMIFGFFFMKKLVFDLVDEVWDGGDSLVVRNRGEEQRIAFTDIKNVNYSPFMHPPRVVLSLRPKAGFGEQIAFCAPMRFVPFASSPIITDLINRIDDARRR